MAFSIFILPFQGKNDNNNYLVKVNGNKKAAANAAASSSGLFVLAVTLLELFDTTACFDVTLTAREERMAFGANVNAEFRFRGTRFERVAAAADDRCFVVLRMDTLFHMLHLAFPQELGIDTSPLCAGLVRPSIPFSWDKASRYLTVEPDVSTSSTAPLYHPKQGVARVSSFLFYRVPVYLGFPPI